MNRAANFPHSQGDDHPLDLPPVAETQHIALVAAVLGTRRGLETGVVAIGLDQQRRIGERQSAGNEGHVHEDISNPPLLALWGIDAVNVPVTMK